MANVYWSDAKRFIMAAPRTDMALVQAKTGKTTPLTTCPKRKQFIIKLHKRKRDLSSLTREQHVKLLRRGALRAMAAALQYHKEAEPTRAAGRALHDGGRHDSGDSGDSSRDGNSASSSDGTVRADDA